MIVTLGTKVIEDEGVIWIIGLFEVTAVERYTYEFTLLSFGIFEV